MIRSFCRNTMAALFTGLKSCALQCPVYTNACFDLHQVDDVQGPRQFVPLSRTSCRCHKLHLTSPHCRMDLIWSHAHTPHSLDEEPHPPSQPAVKHPRIHPRSLVFSRYIPHVLQQLRSFINTHSSVLASVVIMAGHGDQTHTAHLAPQPSYSACAVSSARNLASRLSSGPCSCGQCMGQQLRTGRWTGPEDGARDRA